MEIDDAGGGRGYQFWVYEVGSGGFPSTSVFAYDEEPLGVPPRFEVREKEFFKRFLFNAILKFEFLTKEKVQVVGEKELQ